MSLDLAQFVDRVEIIEKHIDLDKALDLIASGLSITRAAKKMKAKPYQLMLLAESQKYGAMFQAALHAQAEVLADSLLDMVSDQHIAGTSELNVQAAKLKADNVKWLLARRQRDLYGNTVQVQVDTDSDLTDRLARARERVINAIADSGAENNESSSGDASHAEALEDRLDRAKKKVIHH
jgi:hypothetical protein